MDTSEMRELLQGYLSELDWSGEVTKDTVIAHLAGRDDALRTMLDEYVAEGTYASPEAMLNVIPAQAWQDVQGDQWRGAEIQYVEDTPSHYQEGAVGQDDSGVYHQGGPAPQTPGFGQSTPEQGGTTGASGGDAGAGVGGLTGTVSDLGAGLGAGGSTPSAGSGAGAGGSGTVDVDVTVVGVDVTGDGIADAVIVDAVVTDAAGEAEAGSGTGLADESGASAGSGGR